MFRVITCIISAAIYVYGSISCGHESFNESFVTEYSWIVVDSIMLEGVANYKNCALIKRRIYAVMESIYKGEDEDVFIRVYAKGEMVAEIGVFGVHDFVSCGEVEGMPTVLVTYDRPSRDGGGRYVTRYSWQDGMMRDSTFEVPSRMMAHVVEEGKIHTIDAIPGYLTIDEANESHLYTDGYRQGDLGGRYVLFLSDADSTYVHDLRTGAVRVTPSAIPKGSGSYHLSDDGRVIMWAGGGIPPMEARLVDLEKGVVVQLPRSLPGTVAFFQGAHWFTRYDMQQEQWVLSRYREGELDLVMPTPSGAWIAYVRRAGDYLMTIETGLGADRVQRSWIKVYR